MTTRRQCPGCGVGHGELHADQACIERERLAQYGPTPESPAAFGPAERAAWEHLAERTAVRWFAWDGPAREAYDNPQVAHGLWNLGGWGLVLRGRFGGVEGLTDLGQKWMAAWKGGAR